MTRRTAIPLAVTYAETALRYQNGAALRRRYGRSPFVDADVTIDVLLDRSWCCWSAAIKGGIAL